MRPPFGSRVHLAWFTVVASLAIAGMATAATVELTPSKDNTLIQTPADNSNGVGDAFYAGRVGTNGMGTFRRGLLAFDLSTIPAGSTIDSVKLQLDMTQSANLNVYTIRVHRVSADWGEAGSFGSGTGGPAEPGDATWGYRFYDTQAWTTAGGDFTAAPSASQSVGGNGLYSWTGSGLVADVQFWLGNPASNFGWIVIGNEVTLQSVKKFSSRETLVPPKLTVHYTVTTDVPAGPGGEAVWFAPPWPAPASGRVNLGYTLPKATRVSLAIHDAMGRIVRRLVPGVDQTAGRHVTVWDGRTDSGMQVSPGVYLASLVVGEDTYQRRIPLLR
jgi:FlgD Ig-like domain